MSELLFKIDNGIATITLNRPEKLNAFTNDMLNDWVEALKTCRDNPDVRVVILTGAGRAFCSGGDVKNMGDRGEPTPLERKNNLWRNIHRIPKLLEEIDKPVIASLNGLATGAGLDMALMCDLRIAADIARFAEFYIKVGIVPGDGGAYYLPRLVGTSKALELLWLADFVDAQEALRIGMINKVVPAEQLEEETYKWARKLADGPSVAIRLTKRAVYQSIRTDLNTHLDLISSHMAVVTATEDHREAVEAFREKRNPNFRGY